MAGSMRAGAATSCSWDIAMSPGVPQPPPPPREDQHDGLIQPVSHRAGAPPSVPVQGLSWGTFLREMHWLLSPRCEVMETPQPPPSETWCRLATASSRTAGSGGTPTSSSGTRGCRGVLSCWGFSLPAGGVQRRTAGGSLGIQHRAQGSKTCNVASQTNPLPRDAACKAPACFLPCRRHAGAEHRQTSQPPPETPSPALLIEMRQASRPIYHAVSWAAALSWARFC